MNTPELPLVSVCVINYNNAAYLADSVGSVLDQTYPNLEIVFCDDGSTDDSIEVFERLIAERPDIIVQREYAPTNQGIEANMLAGLRVFSGAFVCNLDADDVMHPEHVATLVGLLSEFDADIASTASEKFQDDPQAADAIDSLRSTPLSPRAEPVLFEQVELLDGLFFVGGEQFPFHYWHRLYKRELMKPFAELPDSYFTSSDSAFSLVAFCEADHMVYQDVTTMGYRVRENSAFHKSRYDHFVKREFRSLDLLCEHYGQRCPQLGELNQHKDALVFVELLNSAIRERRGYAAFRSPFREFFGRRPSAEQLEILFSGPPANAAARVMRASLRVSPALYYSQRKLSFSRSR